MTTEEALQAACRDHPSDSTPLSVYADWLDEHDEPIAAFMFRLYAELVVNGQSDGPTWAGVIVLSRFLGWSAVERVRGKVATRPEPHPDVWRGAPKGMDRAERAWVDAVDVWYAINRELRGGFAEVREWPGVDDIQITARDNP